MPPSPEHLVAHQGALFSVAEWQALRALRERYTHGRDLLSEAEENRLRFLYWRFRVGW